MAQDGLSPQESEVKPPPGYQLLDKDSDVKPPKGYLLLKSKSPAASKKVGKNTVKELKIEAAKRKPVVPPKGYVLQSPKYDPSKATGELRAAHTSFWEQAREAVANTAIGHSLEETLPSVADALHLRPSETKAGEQRHRNQLLAPEYLAPALTEAIRTGPLMGSPAPPEGRAPDRLSNTVEGSLRAVGGLTTPENIALMTGIGAVGAGIGEISPVAARVLGRVASGAFTVQMLKGLYDQSKAYRAAVDAGDVDEAQKIQGEMGVNGIMALLAGKHALIGHPYTPIEQSEIPTRERTNVLHRNAAGEVRQAKGQAPTVWLSPDAWAKFSSQMFPGEDAGNMNGVNIEANENLRGFATDPRVSAENPELKDLQELLAKAHENATKGGVAIAKKRGSIQDNIRVMREELNHTWQRGLANGNVNQHLDPQQFTNLYHAIPSGMYDHLIENGYDGRNSPEIVTEAAAKLMDGRPERFGVTEDDAVDFLDKYFKEVTDKHGAKALEELHHVRGIAADAKARAIEEHGRTGARQDNNSVSGVAGGGQGGDAEGLQAAGEKVDDNNSQNVTTTDVPVSYEEPADLRNVHDNTGMAGEVAFNREQEKDKPIWYLKSERLIGEKMRGPMPAADVQKMLLAGGVKPEEMHWTGLEDFLKSKGNESVTPQEIKDHLAANNLQIKEVTKGGQFQIKPSSDNSDEFDVVDATGRVRFTGNSREEAQDYIDDEDNARGGTGTKYGSYVLPGGEPNSYREMLITMPPQEALSRPYEVKYNPDAKPSEAWELLEKGNRKAYADSNAKAHAMADNLWGKDWRDANPVQPRNFTSGHWDEPNILAHVRFNDRTGPNGEKLLHVEEVQSDFAQSGRKKGFTDPKRQQELSAKVDAAKKDYDAVDKELEASRNDLLEENLSDTYNEKKIEELKTKVRAGMAKRATALAALRSAKIDLDNYTNTTVPDMPWKRNWHEQALRRIIRHAVDNDYSGVSWTGGEDQADRYSLAKQISRLEYFPVDGTLNAFDHSGSRVMRKVATPEELPDYIGKEAANKLLQTPRVDTDTMKEGDETTVEYNGEQRRVKIHPDRRLNEGKRNESVMVTGIDDDRNMRWFVPLSDLETHTLANADLKVGGEGMKGFYDKIVPDFLNKFGKKYGARVGTTEIESDSNKYSQYKGPEFSVSDLEKISKDRSQNGSVRDQADDVAYAMRNGIPFDKAIVVHGSPALASELNGYLVPEGKSRTVQYLPITPEMRKSVGEEGVPLFNRERENPNFPDKDNWIKLGAQEYAREHGRNINLPRYIAPDFRAKDIADAYDEMKHNPADPKVKASYDALKKEIRAQWDHATKKMGVTFEPWKGEGQPYKNSAEMTKDVRDNHHLYFFQGGDMPADHPLAEVDPVSGLSDNDRLRAVHDLFGHAMDGYEFGKRGEENAWNAHSQMFSPETIPALTTETKGQNSWVNFGKQMRDAKGNVIEMGQPGWVHPKDRPYADQKAGLLPDRFHYRIDTPISFISPNVDSLDLKGAASRVDDAPHKMLKTLSDSLAESLNLKPKTNDAIGHWDGGAENSLIHHFPMNADPDAIRYHDANLALLGNQNAWAAFFPKEGGADDLFVFDAPKGATPEQISQAMSKHGIEQHTMEKHPDGVYREKAPDAPIIDEKDVLHPKVDKQLDPESRSGKLAAWVEAQGPKIVSDYIQKFAQNGVPYISPDAAKEMIPEYVKDPTGVNLDAGVAAGAITHAAWDSLLAQKPEPGKEAVIISTGSPASGKTSGILTKDQQASVGITRETIPHDISALSKTIDEVIASGRSPILMLTYTEDPKINMARAITRALKEGRTVPLDYMTKAWLEQPKIAAEALKKYGDQIGVYAIDNSGNPGEHKVYANDLSSALDIVSAYSPKKVMEAYREVLDQYRPTIPANIYEGFLKSAFQEVDDSTTGEGDRGEVSGEFGRSEDIGATGQSQPTSVVPVQGNTVVTGAPVMVPVVPVPTKHVLPLHKVKEMAAARNPNVNSQPQVRSVRELMAEARSRMVP